MMEVKVKTSEKNLVPKLRFGEFDSLLSTERLDKLVSFKSGGTPAKDNDRYWNGNIPWISAASMTGKYYAKSERTLTEEGLNNGSRLAPAGVLLLLVRGSMLYKKVPIGITALDVAFNQDLKALIPNDKCETHFLYQWFCSQQNILLNKVTGTGIGAGKLDTDDLKALKLNLPTLPEQQKIAAFLSAVDEKIQQLNKKKELLEAYKKGVMQKLFSQEVRFKHTSASLSAGDGSEFPAWEEKRLGEIAIKVNNKNKQNDIVYVLTNSAIQGIVGQSDYFDRAIANQNNLEGYYIVQVNDFIYNPRISVHAPVGPIKRNKLREGVMSPLYTVFRFRNVHLEYMECFFSTTKWYRYLNSVANFGARHDRMNISQNDFFRMPIDFPSLKEQQKIATFLSSLDAKIKQVNTQTEQMKLFKKGLLQQMFV